MFFWLGLLVLFIIIEMITPLELMTVWFMPAAIVCAILAFLGVDYGIQLTVFVILSLIGTVCLFLYMKRRAQNTDTHVMQQRFRGRHVVQTVDPDGTCRVKIKDVEYAVREANGLPLTVGDPVEIVRIEGNTLYVKKQEQQKG